MELAPKVETYMHMKAMWHLSYLIVFGSRLFKISFAAALVVYDAFGTQAVISAWHCTPPYIQASLTRTSSRAFTPYFISWNKHPI